MRRFTPLVSSLSCLAFFFSACATYGDEEFSYTMLMMMTMMMMMMMMMIATPLLPMVNMGNILP